MATTTARRLPRRHATTPQLLPHMSQLLLLLTQSQLRDVSTSQSVFQESPVRTSAVVVAYPEPVKGCVNKPISLPRITCEDISVEKCITVPEVEEGIETVDKCITQLAAPACQQVELTLPKQVCKEINYGYAEETHDVEPVTYAPPPPPPTYAPAPAYAAEA